ncbi:MAG: NADH-quinone oxidoreductase subunit C, partial [Acidimicrobiales bacterium]
MADGPDIDDAPAPEVTSPAPELVHGAPVSWSGGDKVLHPDRADLERLVRALRDDDGYLMCLDVCGVDYLTYEADRALPPGVEAQRFEVVVTLISHADRNRLRIRVQVPADDPSCPSLFDVHPGSEAMEREVFDLFGLSFDGHPDLTRILMPEDWDGHPL